MDQLRQPSPTYRSNTNLPSHITQYNITIPHINDITEKIAYILAGFPPQFLLGNQMHINIDNLRMGGLMLHRAICEQLGQNLTNTFPQPTSRFATCYYFSLRLHQIYIDGQTKHVLALLVNGNDHIFSSITTALTNLCNTNSTFDNSLPIFLYGLRHELTISLHSLPSDQRNRDNLLRQIYNTNTNILSMYKLIQHVPVLYKTIENYYRNVIDLISATPECVAIFPDFKANGVLYLTFVFKQSRETNFFTAFSILDTIRPHFPHLVAPSHKTPNININTNPSNNNFSTNNTNFVHSLQTNPPQTSNRTNNNNTFRNDNNIPNRSNTANNNRRVSSTTPIQLHRQLDKTQSHFQQFKQSSLTLHIQPSNKFYCLVNGAGGIALANIYAMTNFDHILRNYVDGVSYAVHKSFATREYALQYLKLFYPFITTLSDIDHINANCCSITSNLNNPSPQIQETIQIRSATRSTQPNEVFYFNDLAEDAKRLRLAADTRRKNLNLSIIASYTFSDGEINLLDNSTINYNNTTQQQQQQFTNHNNTTQQQQQQFPNNNNNHQPPTPSIHIPTFPTNSSTPTNHHHRHDIDFSNHNHNMDDNTLDSSSLPASQSSANPAPKKKKRGQTQFLLGDDKQLFVNAKTSLFTSPTKTRNQLGKALRKAGQPDHIISNTMVCRALNVTEKIIQFTVLDRQYGQFIFDALNSSTKFEATFSNMAIQPHTTDEIELPPTNTTNSFPFHCPFTTCPAHNGGFPYFERTENGQLMAQTHSTELHSDLLLSLPLTTLTTLGWTKCCNNCHELYLIRDDLTAHQTECIYFSAHISQQRTSTPFSLHTNMSLHLSPKNQFESTTQSQHE